MWTTSRSPWCHSPAEAVHRSFCGRNSPNSTEPYAATVVIYAERGRVRRRYRRTDDHGVDLLATGHGEGKGSCLSFLQARVGCCPSLHFPRCSNFSGTGGISESGQRVDWIGTAHHSVPEPAHTITIWVAWGLLLSVAGRRMQADGLNQFSVFVFGLIPAPCSSDLRSCFRI
jgi:hypothetical protein